MVWAIPRPGRCVATRKRCVAAIWPAATAEPAPFARKLGIKLEGQGGLRDLVQVIFRSDDLYERIVTGKGRHYQFPDANGSSIIAQGDRKQFTPHGRS